MNETKSRKKHGHKYCGFSYEKRHFQVRKIENWFSERLPHMGDKKKLVARISKSEPLILKSKPLIFCPQKTRFKTTPKMRTKKALRFCVILCGHFNVRFPAGQCAALGMYVFCADCPTVGKEEYKQKTAPIL